MNAILLRSRIIALLAIALALGFLAYTTKGLSVAWAGGDSDLRIREREWADFSKGIYPNLRYSPEGMPRASSHSVYPAYALPMFAPFLGPGNFQWARISLEIASFAGLAAMMALGWQALRYHGWQAGWVGLFLGPAISGNCSTFALGQFSLISSGLIAAQILALRSNHPFLAGVFWFFAMIKPQIAFPFALLFLIRGQWRGFLLGCAMLGATSLLALEWTGWTLQEYLVHSLGSERLTFAIVGPFSFAGWMPVSPPIATGIAIALVAMLGLALWIFIGGLAPRHLLVLSGLAAMLGWVLFYHRQYDNQMLFPLMLGVAVRGFESNWKLPELIVCALLGLTLYLPSSMVADFQAVSLLAILVPLGAAVFLVFKPAIGFVKTENTPSPSHTQ